MHKIGAISIDASLRILAGTKSGPEALAGLRLLRSFTIPGTVKTISDIDGTDSPSIFGRSPVGSLVNWEIYWEFKASATSAGSLTSLPLVLRTGMLLCPDFFCFM